MIKIKNKDLILDHGNIELRSMALKIIEEGIDSVLPENLIRKYVFADRNSIKIGKKKFKNIRKVVVIGAGKATYNMAFALESIMADKIESGAITVPYGSYKKLKKIEVFQASHPVLDINTLKGTEKMLEHLKGLTTDDLVICLISGGASSLLELLPEGIALLDLQRLNSMMLDSGADIMEFNMVRKHLSLVKGGKLSRLIYPANSVSLILSDVPNNDLTMIGSGPTIFDTTVPSDAYNVLEKYGLTDKVPEPIKNYLRRKEEQIEPSKYKTLNILIGTNYTACKAANASARKIGLRPMILSTSMEGESKVLGAIFANIANECKRNHVPLKPPCAVIMGGETTVSIDNVKGRGGRNLEFVLGALLNLIPDSDIVVASVGTDGIDGTSGHAGSICDRSTLDIARKKGLDPERFLSVHDTATFFEMTGDAIDTGKTNTNVSDLRVAIIR